MIFYIVNLLFMLLYAVLICILRKNKIKRNKTFLILACIHLGLIMALRSYNVGADTKTYAELFVKIATSYDFFSVIDSAPLYVLYNKGLSYISTNTQFIIIMNSLLIMVGMGIFLYRNSSNPIMSMYYFVTLYFYFRGFNIARQFIAIVIVINSYYYLKNQEYKKYFLLIFIATLVHNTAVVGLVLYTLRRISWSNKRIGILAVVTTISMLSYEKILNIFLKIFPRYSMYMGGGTFNLTDTGEGKKILVSIFYLGLVILCLLALKFKKNKDQLVKNEMYFLTAIMTVAVVIGVLFYNNMLISRIEIYFSIFAIIYIPKIIDYIGGREKVLLHYGTMLVTAVPMLAQLSYNISRVVPYEAFWNAFY